MSLIQISGVTGTTPDYQLTVDDSTGAQVGDHVAAPLDTPPAGQGGVYRVTGVPDGTHIDITDDLDPDGGTYGDPGAGAGQFYTPTTHYTLSQSVDGGPNWGPAARRDLQVLDSNLAEAEEIRTTEDFTVTVDYATGVSPPAGTVVSSQADFDALGAPLKYPQEAIEVLPNFVDHRVYVDIAAGDQYARDLSGFYGFGATLDLMCLPGQSPRTSLGPWTGTHTDKAPGVIFRGATSDVETGVVGTATAGNASAHPTFVRDTGTWVPDEHAGKYVEVTSGAGAGTRAIIAHNTADTLQLVGSEIASGAATIKIYENTTYLLPQTAAATTTFYTLSGNLFHGRNVCGFENINFSSPSVRQYGLVTFGLNINYSECVFHCQARHDQAYLTYGLCQMAYVSTDHNGIYLYDKTRVSLFDVYCVGAAGFTSSPIYGRDQCFVYINSVLIELPAGSTAPCLSLLRSATEISGLCIADGGGTGIGLSLDGNGMDDVAKISNLVINNCATAVRAARAAAIVNAMNGSGNDRVFDVAAGADIAFDAGNSCIGTDFARIDGEVFDATYFTDAGDAVTGQHGAQLRSH